MRTVTIAFGPHRVEMLDLMQEQIRRHQVVILEEPEHQDFERMLKREVGIRGYLAAGAFGFPRFMLRACRLYQQLYTAQGTTFYQADPYLTIAKGFMEGKQPRSDLENAVWNSEHHCTNSLLKYYQAVAQGGFADMVRTTVNFARADANRIRFREKLRSRAIAKILSDTQGDVYVEAGYIHLALYSLLRKELPPPAKTRGLFLLRGPIRDLSNLPCRQHLSPGDILTLREVFAKRDGVSNLLAAQSLIYVSLISKEEKLPTRSTPYPHLMEELYLCRWVRRLGYNDCEGLYQTLGSRASAR